MNMKNLHIIMPVKDSLATTRQALQAIVDSGYSLTVYNDNSTAENTAELHSLSIALGFRLVDIATLTDHPSPNYRLVLLMAREQALRDNAHLIIIESDVIVQQDTIRQLCAEAEHTGSGLIASVTHDQQGKVNFPYEYAQRIGSWAIGTGSTVQTRKRLSFCCTLLTNELLKALDFEKELDPEKNWYDVTISHRSIELGFTNLLMLDNPVLHLPHSSRPWKQLKYTNPLLYYWRKLTQHKDKI